MENRNRIMIVDDNPIDRMLTQRVLQTNYVNWDIMVMQSALKALDYLDNHENDINALPSLIILDLDMPGVNGFGFLERFSHYNETIKNTCKIIVLTATDAENEIEQMQSDPHISKLIAKPLTKNALVPMA
jgi:CheY-like chemotaxis protein